jgi:hypothetical protein
MFEGKRLGRPDREKNLLIFGHCQNFLDHPPPLHVFLVTYKECLFKKKRANEKDSYCLNLRRKVSQKCLN